MDIKTLNERISELDQDESLPFMIHGGKSIPYQGWYWRSISADYIPLAFNGHWVGFCENNKWGYPSVAVRGDAAAVIVGLLEAVASDPSASNLKALYDHLQTYKQACDR